MPLRKLAFGILLLCSVIHTNSAEVTRNVSAGNSTYYINPTTGDDSRAGTSKENAWQTFAKINALFLSAGDKIIISPGTHSISMMPSGAGTMDKPIIIEFLPGVHAFGSEKAYRRPYYISNAADEPTRPIPIALFLENAQHVSLRGGGVSGSNKTTILLAGPERTTYFINDHSEDISFTGLAFDLKRPTVSEFRVIDVEENRVTIQIEEASSYAINAGKFSWTGDMGSGMTLVQQAIPSEGRAWRVGKWDPFSTAKAEELGDRKVRLTYEKGNFGMIKDRQFQFRCITRNVVTAHNTRCKNISFRDCDFYAMTGMGIVSQFTDGMTFERVRVAPKKGTLRTCPAWADIFHFSGCRGQITVNECLFSGSQDDAINVHGTYVRIIGKPAANQLLLRFMHNQTFGFPAFMPGDEIAVVRHSTLCELANNPHRKVTAIVPNQSDSSGREWLLTLDGAVPSFEQNDVVDNISWYPDVTIKNCKVEMSSCRGFLLTTPGKVLVEGCEFHRCTMSSILIGGDAEGWFESGSIHDLTLRNNSFIGNGIEIAPESRSKQPEDVAHQNIRIEDNYFEGASIKAKNTRNLVIAGNRFAEANLPASIHESCSEVTIEKNTLGVKR